MNNAVNYGPSMKDEVNNWVPMYNVVNGPFKNNIVINSTPTNMTYANVVRNTCTENVSTGPSINERGPAQNEE